MDENGLLSELLELLLIVVIQELLGFMISRITDTSFDAISEAEAEAEAEVTVIPESTKSVASSLRSTSSSEPDQEEESKQSYKEVSNEVSNEGSKPDFKQESQQDSQQEPQFKPEPKPDKSELENDSKSQQGSPSDEVQEPSEPIPAPASKPQAQKDGPSVEQTYALATENTGALILRPLGPLSLHGASPLPSSLSVRTTSSLPSPTLPVILPLVLPYSSTPNSQLPPQILKLSLIDEHSNNPSTGQNSRKHAHDLEIKIDNLQALSNLSLPNSKYKFREPAVSDVTAERRYVNNDICWALVAKQEICTGSILFAEEVISVWSDEEKACKDHQEVNAMLEQKAKRIGLEWKPRVVLRFRPGKKNLGQERKLGVKGETWEQHHLHATCEGRVDGELGVNLAWENNSCIPNCSLQYMNEHEMDEDGGTCGDKKPKLDRVVLRACADILSRVEISVTYVPTPGMSKMRRRDAKRLFDFWCECRICATPHASVDTVMHKYQRLKCAIDDPNIIADRPAIALQVACGLTEHLYCVHVHDTRLIDIWVKCAVIAGYHSDQARAHCFLKKARELVLILEGITSSFHHQIENWYRCLENMPGYGGTKRGLSAPAEATPILDGGRNGKRALFMLGTRPDEYVRVSRYRPRSADNEETSAPEKEQPWEVVEGLDPAPPKLNLDAEGPSDMCRNRLNYEATVRAKEVVQERRKRRKNRKHTERKEGRRYLNSVCVDPENDFLDAFLAMAYGMFGPKSKKSGDSEQKVNDDASEVELEHQSEGNKELGKGCQALNGDREAQQNADVQAEEKQEKGPKRKKRGKNKKRSDATPAVKDVGAEKKVTVVEVEDAVSCTCTCDAEVEKHT
ncbi:hypothetical protein BJX76DRAFT_356061 [Aspergillus varians]